MYFNFISTGVPCYLLTYLLLFRTCTRVVLVRSCLGGSTIYYENFGAAANTCRERWKLIMKESTYTLTHTYTPLKNKSKYIKYMPWKSKFAIKTLWGNEGGTKQVTKIWNRKSILLCEIYVPAHGKRLLYLGICIGMEFVTRTRTPNLTKA